MTEDFDQDGNNIVPCPICLNNYCPSKENKVCPEEKQYKEDMELRSAHDKFAEANNAEFFNYGWATGPNFIHSKTNKGRIYTERNEQGEITHEFTQ